MSEENSPSPEAPAETKPRVRRVSNPRPKKAAAVKSAEKKEAAAPAEAAAAAETASAPAPAQEASPAKTAPVREPEVSENAVESTSSQEWPEPETISEGSSGSGESKKKRRRRKGKGGQNASSGSGHEESGSGQQAAPQQQPRTNGGQQGHQGGHQQHQAGQSHQHSPRIPVDSEALAKKAWKIYLSEVSEEGIALINDHDAKELSRRCFRLAEIFLDEQNRRIRQ